MAGNVALAIMCKAPISGESKTRLCPPLKPDEAAALSRCFIADVAATVAAVSAEGGAQGYALITPTGEGAAFAGLLPDTVPVRGQCGPDLSARLVHAVREMLAAGHSGVCLINADGPTLPAGLLARAAAVLAEPEAGVVLIPAIDGGYALVGLKRDKPLLFADIPWSTSQVLAQTLARAAALGLPVSLLPPWYDVDDTAGLELLCHELFGGGAFPLAGSGLEGAPAPRTAAFLEDLLHGERGEQLRFIPRPAPDARRRPPPR